MTPERNQRDTMRRPLGGGQLVSLYLFWIRGVAGDLITVIPFVQTAVEIRKIVVRAVIFAIVKLICFAK